MKNLFTFLMLSVFTISGYSQQSNGFGPGEGQTIALGSQKTVDIFMKFDKAWAERDYETIKSYIIADAKMKFADGTTVIGPDEFVKQMQKEYEKAISSSGSGWGWDTISAVSLKVIGGKDPSIKNQRGEWVNAQFIGNDKSITMEWYQIYEGKIVYWYQANGKASKE